MKHKSTMRAPLPQSSCGMRVRADAQVMNWLLAGAIWVLLMAALPGYAQTAPQPMPENASAKSYGDGWECDIGFRINGDVCAAVVLPENAYETKRTYGRGWECLHGFNRVGEAECIAVTIPEGGFLDPSGERWSCLRGYIKRGDRCEEINLPANAYLAASSYGQPWICDRGFEAVGDTCAAIAVPANAFLNNANHGPPWTCERGFFEQADQCAPVVIPANAYFDDATYGKGWSCDRGYAASGPTCAFIDIPANAHLDRSGNRWVCDRNFQKFKGQCLLND